MILWIISVSGQRCALARSISAAMEDDSARSCFNGMHMIDAAGCWFGHCVCWCNNHGSPGTGGWAHQPYHVLSQGATSCCDDTPLKHGFCLAFRTLLSALVKFKTESAFTGPGVLIDVKYSESRLPLRQINFPSYPVSTSGYLLIVKIY